MNTFPAIMTVALRLTPVLGAMLRVSVPLPAPLAPDVTAIQPTSLVAVHAHAPVPETAIGAPTPPAAVKVSLVRLSEYEQLPAWLTVNVNPSTVRVPTRAAPLFAAIRKLIVPAPLPLAGEAIVIHGTSLLAFHEQPAALVTANAPLPPPTSPH